MSSTWKHIWLLWLCGVVAAAEFGKFAPLLGLLGHERGLSLPAAGWLSSMIELGGATCGVLGSRFVRGLGSRRAIQLGLTLLILGGGIEFAFGAPGLWLGRVVESAGYLLVVVSAPSLMMHLAGDHERAHAMSLWSTFVPVGLAAGAVLSGTFAPWVGLSATLGAWAVVPCVTLVLTRFLPATAADSTPAGTQPTRRPGPAIWWLCTAFWCYAVLFVGLVALLPTFLQTVFHQTTSSAGAIAGMAAVASIAGSAITAWRLHRDRSRFSPAAIRDLDILGLAVPAALLAWLYAASSGANHPGMVAVAGLTIAAFALSGIVPALMFATLSHAAHRPDGAHPALVNGILTHFGATGSLVGPPLLAFISIHAGWGAAAYFVLALSLGTFLLAFKARQYLR